MTTMSSTECEGATTTRTATATMRDVERGIGTQQAWIEIGLRIRFAGRVLLRIRVELVTSGS